MSPYRYSEDSRLLGDYLSFLDGSGAYLEIGVGGGGNLSKSNLLEQFCLIVGTDIIDLTPVRKELHQPVEVVMADRGTCFRPESFDVIAFNPPYLPSDEIVDRAIDGGPSGIVVPLQFLESALAVLKKNGRIIMLLSSDDSIDGVRKFCEERNLSFTKVAETAVFFEWLFLFSIRQRKSNG